MTSRSSVPSSRPVVFWISHAVRGMRSGLLIQLASTSSIALSLLLFGLALLGLLNVDRITRQWGRGVHIIVYLKPEAPAARVKALYRTLGQRPEVDRVRWITPRQAHKQLRANLGSQGSVLQGVEAGLLPGSLEISLRRDRPDQVRTLISLLSASSLVEEVDHMGDWAKRLASLVTLLEALGLAVALVVAAACLYIVGSTIRLGVHARREEIEILKLVGATDRFVRAPFMIEGTLQGLLGAALACSLLYGAFRLAGPRLEGLMAAVFSHARIGFLPPGYLAAYLALGGLLGLVGSRLALGRYLEV